MRLESMRGLSKALVSLSLASSAAALAAPSRLPASLQQKVQSFRADLTASGYEVAQGEFHLFQIADCKYALQTIGNCMGNNPTAPYIIPTVPQWKDEFVDEHMKDLIGPAAENTGWTHRLSERDALVVLAQMPPTGRYFGIQPYVFTRKARLNPADPIYRSLEDPFMKSILFMYSPNPERALTFASVGDSVNNVVIERQSGAAFDQQRYFIITSDAGLAGELSEALLRAGVPDKRQIFTLPVSPSTARLGLDASADEFMTFIRYAMPKDEAAGDQWRHQLPLALLRVRSVKPTYTAQPYAKPVRDARIARSEEALKGDVDDLVAAVKEQWGQTKAHDSSFRSLLLLADLVGEHCLARPMNCLGDTEDTDYQISETASLDSGEILAVAGTLGTATGNAVYTSLSVNRIPELVGTVNLADTDLAGSTAAFADSVGNTDKLYLQYFARDCKGLSHCLQVTEQMVPHGGKLKIIQRNYVVPGSARGADPRQVVNPRLVVLKRD